MAISAISFASNKQKKINAKNKLSNNINLSVPNNYKIIINPQKEKLIMSPQPQEDIYKPSAKNQSGKVKKDKKDQKEKKAATEEENKEASLLEKVKKGTRIAVTIIMSALSVLGIKEGKDILEYVPDVTSTVVDFDSNQHDIAGIASAYNIDEDVIRYSNGIYSDEDLNRTTSLKIPTQFDYLSDKIDQKTQDLFRADPYSQEYYAASKELDALCQKEEEQNAVADLFSDGEVVYISLKSEEEAPELTEKFKGDLVPVSYFQKLFDIKDEELNKYNSFISKDNNQYIQLGATIKVPVFAINSDNINLSGYLK